MLQARAAMVCLSLALTATSARSAQDLLDALRFVAQSVRHDPGCLGCSAWTDPDCTIRYTAQWASEAELQRHVQSDLFTSLLSIVEAATEPRVEFDFVTMSRGLDYVAEIRRTTPWRATSGRQDP